MNNKDYKYDVAFSFLTQDEGLALQINDLIKNRVKTFIYPEKQKELAGKNGEEAFSRVFESEARFVFVLYRDGWGDTPWTRIEQTAIRNRAFDTGYDFVLFAKIDTSSTVPKWLPKTQIWIGIERWGVEGAASVIEARVQEMGGAPIEETVDDRALRQAKEIKDEIGKRALLNSEQGVRMANEAAHNLFSEIERITARLTDDPSAINLNFEAKTEHCRVFGSGFSISLYWHSQFSNSLSDARLYLTLYTGIVSIRGGGAFPFTEPKELKKIVFQFDLARNRSPFWREETVPKRSFSTNDLAGFIIAMLLEKIANPNDQ